MPTLKSTVDINDAIQHLQENDIEAFELMGILVIPTDNPAELDVTVSKISKLLRAIGYEKSWRVDPYYYERHKSIEGEMYK